ncbi:MAG: DUF2281 domain-containing protein [Chitinivibrionales bacterium]|nr:DUF2281 domain-containing protein [Chitinivibrionales bacterium]
MVAPQELPERIRHTVEELPYEKQQEVFDFAEYLRNKVKNQNTGKNSLADLIGIIEGPEDLSSNHDEIYD